MQKNANNKTFEWIVENSSMLGMILIALSLFLNLFMTAALTQSIQWITSI